MAACAQCGASLPDDARFCLRCGAPVEAAAPADERKVATVVFADLVGSTELADAEDPERTRALLDRFYDAMAEEIEGAGGTVEKFAGDAVMAAFGAPSALEDHAERALHAALSMNRRLHELFGDRLALRIGVNTGEVVVGRPREGSSFVTGDAVNVAARLEQVAAPGDVLVGERTAAVARGAFEFDDGRVVEAKGKPDGVRCHRLVRALSVARPRGIRGVQGAFVGRRREVDLLDATYRRVADGAQPHLVTIMGDAGVGKSTVVRRLWDALAPESQEPAPLRRSGRCLAYGQGITYWPLGEVLKEHLGLLDSDPPERARELLSGREILGLTLGLEVDDLHPLAARERLHEAWVELLTSLAAERPVVLLVEDLHWAEDDLLDLLERLVQDVTGPLLVIGTARPELLEARPTWSGGRRNASLLWLEPLDDADAGEMVDALFDVPLPDDVRHTVVERAEGNPFFVEELLGALLDSGALRRADGAWSVARALKPSDVPDSVQAVVASRIDLLPAAEKAALQAAAVVGRVFWARPVRALVGSDADLSLLEERDFVRRRVGSSFADDQEYAIKHALTREVAYASVPKARRARLHASLADWLAEQGAHDERAPLLAHHYAEAARPADADLAWADDEAELARVRASAVGWLRRAAELAVGRYEIEQAVGLLERALELEQDRQAQADLWRQIGLARALRYDGERFRDAMLQSIQLSTDDADRAETLSQLALHTAIRSGMWPRRPPRELVEGWVSEALALAAPGGAAEARALVARAAWDPASADAGAHNDARRAEAVALSLGDDELLSWTLAARTAVAFHDRDFAEAEALARRRLEIAEQLTDADHVLESYESAVPALTAAARFDDARRYAALHAERSRALSPHHRIHSFALASEIDEALGCWDALRARVDDLRAAVAENLETPCVRNARSMLITAVAFSASGDEAAARELESAAAEAAPVAYEGALAYPRARLALLRGDLDALEPLLAEQLGHRYAFGPAPLATRLDAFAALRDRERLEAEAPRLLVPGIHLEPFALRGLGIVRGDAALVDRAQERFAALGLDWHARQTEALLGL